ncbi:MAG TPA: hypothetical protein VIL00_18285 [Pseudonocardiaceae bacterium]
MIKVVKRVECGGVEVENDPYIVLDVSWRVKARADTLYLMVRGLEGGYVELKVNSTDGALVELIVIERPPEVDGFDNLPVSGSGQGCLTPALDLDLWPWKITPDYSEPAVKIARVESKLGMCIRAGVVTLMLSGADPVEFIGGGPVRVGIGQNGEMACVVAVLE